MGKHTKYMEEIQEIQAWKDFELEFLDEPEPPLEPNYAGGISYCDEEIPSFQNYLDYWDYWDEPEYDDWFEYQDMWEFGSCYDD